MGAFQLPDSVLDDAAACLIYSFVCLLANCLLVWLIWTHHERTSYVAFIAYFTFLATVSSIVQQFYDYIFWQDIMEAQFLYAQEHAHDAEVQYQNSIFGLKLALSYVRIFSIIVEASLVFFFSLSLAATVYGWWAKQPRALRNLSVIGRVIPIAMALISIILLQLEFTHDNFTAYLVIANAQYVIALCGSCIFLLMILYKYVQSRRQLRTWQAVQYGQGGGSRTTTTTNSQAKSALSRRSRAFSSGTSRPSNATMDNWLVVRLTIALLTLGVFEWTNLAPRFNNRRNVLETLTETEADLSHKRAMSTVTGYLSGVSPSMLAFIVFGTTKTFQRKMWRTFVPRALRRRISGAASSRSSSRKGDRDEGGDAAAWRRGSLMPAPSTAHSSRARASVLAADNGSGSITFGTPKWTGHSVSITSTSTPTTATTTTTTATTMPSSTRKLGPIYEPGCMWLDEDDEDDDDDDSPHGAETRGHVRRSQIGLAVSVPALQPPPPTSSSARTTTTTTTNDTLAPRKIFPLQHEDPDDDDDDDDDDAWRAARHGHGHGGLEAGPDGLASIPLSRFNHRSTRSRGYSFGSGYGHRLHGSDAGSGSPVVWGGARRGSEGGVWGDRASRYAGVARQQQQHGGGGVGGGSGNYGFPPRRGSAV